jgi:hypothetical protein
MPKKRVKKGRAHIETANLKQYVLLGGKNQDVCKREGVSKAVEQLE